MKLKFITTILVCMPLCLFAQNIFKGPGFSFEDKNGVIGGYNWIETTARDYISVSSEQAFDGRYSLKYNTLDLPETGNIKAYMPIIPSLGEGSYLIKARIFVVKGDIARISLVLTSSKEWQSKNIPTNNIEKGKWVEVSAVANFKKDKNVKTLITVTGSPKWGGHAEFYLDKIELIKGKF